MVGDFVALTPLEINPLGAGNHTGVLFSINVFSTRSRSMRDSNTTNVILSAERVERSPKENFDRSVELATTLESTFGDFIYVAGVYKGVKEVSFLVTVASGDADAIREARDLARSYEQEEILEISAGFAFLVTLAKTPETRDGVILLGFWREISQPAAVNIDHSCIDGRYFTII